MPPSPPDLQQASPPKLSVCIAADNASVSFGGEAILPFHYFRLLRQRGVDAWLVVHDRVRTELESLLSEERSRILFVRDSRWQRVFNRIGNLLPRGMAESTCGLLNILITQYAQRGVIRTLVAEKGVTVLHQPTPVSPRSPSLFFGMGIPLVVGPMNGGMTFPPGLRGEDHAIDRIFVNTARKLSQMGNALLPGKHRASVLLVANERTLAALPSGARGKAQLLVENGVDLEAWTHHEPTHPEPSAAAEDHAVTPASAGPRFVFVGRLVSVKALQIALEALTQVPLAQLDVIGAGPMLEPWRTLAAELGISDRVRFLGWLPQSACAAHLRSATALVLPSLYECGGAVVLEAMAMGRPVIATRWGGPADYLDDATGILVSPDSYAALVAGFAAAMQRLAADPQLCHQLGARARAKVLEQFTWEQKINRILEIYASAQRAARTETGQNPHPDSALLEDCAVGS